MTLDTVSTKVVHQVVPSIMVMAVGSLGAFLWKSLLLLDHWSVFDQTGTQCTQGGCAQKLFTRWRHLPYFWFYRPVLSLSGFKWNWYIMTLDTVSTKVVHQVAPSIMVMAVGSLGAFSWKSLLLPGMSYYVI